MKPRRYVRLCASVVLAYSTAVFAGGADDLPSAPDGTPILPNVTVNVSVVGSYFWSRLQGQTPQQHIWGEAGEAIDSALSALGIDIENESGTFQFYVVFVLQSSAVTTQGTLDKEAGEDLEAAFERERGASDSGLPHIGIAMPSGDEGAEGGGGLDDPSGGIGDPVSDSLVFPPNSIVVVGGGSSNLWCGPGTDYICIY